MKLSRRSFLRGSGATLGLAATAGVGAYTIGKPRALAAPPDVSASIGAIFLVLNGGARTQALFNGRVGVGTNPFGQLTGMPVELPDLTMNGSGLELPEINKYLNMISTASHHNRTNIHSNGRTVACTGSSPLTSKTSVRYSKGANSPSNS